MTSIDEAANEAAKFLKRILKVDDVKVIRAARAGDGWEINADVYEDSSLIKSLGLGTKVKDRNVYTVRLNEALGVESYELKGQSGSAE